MEKSKRPTLIQRFLLFASGTDLETLKNCSNRASMVYTGLGITVLVPAVMGFFAAYYFLLTVFKTSGYLTLIGSVISTLIIFSFDRFLVMTFRKSAYSSKGRFFLAIFGRVALSVLFAYVIASALVLRVFQPNIDQFLYSKNSLKKNAIVAKYAPSIARRVREINALELANLKDASYLYHGMPSAKQIKNLRGEINKVYDAWHDELAGKDILTGKGPGPVSNSLKKKLDYLKTQLQEATKSAESKQLIKMNTEAILEKKAEIARIEQTEKAELKKFQATRADDFLTRSDALEELAKKNGNVRKWNFLVTLIFIVVDIMPLLFKMSLGKDEYDWKLETDQITAEADEVTKREVLTLTKEARQKTALLKRHYTNAQEQLKDLTDHHANMLDLFSAHIDTKMKHDVSFMEKMMKHGQASQNAGDQEDSFQEVRAEAWRDYFKNSSDMSRNAARFFGSHFNGRSNGHDHPDLDGSGSSA